MNRLWIGIAALVALAAVAFFVFNRPQNTEAVRIGVVLPLSGSMAEYGDNGRNGLTLAQEELSRDAAMRGVELIYQDSGDTPEGSVTAVRRLIDVEGVQYIIGGLTSSGTLAAAPYAQERGVLFFTPAASAPGIPEIGDMVFRNWPADDTIARALDELYALGMKPDWWKLEPQRSAAAWGSIGDTIAGMAEASYAQIAPHLYCGPVEGAANIQLAASLPNKAAKGIALPAIHGAAGRRTRWRGP